MKNVFKGSDYILSNAEILIKKPKKSLQEVFRNTSGGKKYKSLESLLKDVKLEMRKR